MRNAAFFAMALAVACEKPPPMPPSEPQHIPGTDDTGYEAVPTASLEPAAPIGPRGLVVPGEPPSEGPEQVLASGSTDPGEGRLKARPHPLRQATRPASGAHKLGLGGGRDGLVFVPSGYQPATPAPLLVLLHGAGRDADRMMHFFRDRAEEAGVILVIPDSRGQTWDMATLHRFGDDVSFIDFALAKAFDSYNVDPARVAVGGFSDGASYALSLGLTNGDLFGQIVALSPGFAAPGQVRGKPRVFVAHGRADRILSISSTRRMVEILERTGYDVRFKEFDGPHEMPPQVLDAAVAWLVTGR